MTFLQLFDFLRTRSKFIMEQKNAEDDKRTLYVGGLSDDVDLEILGGLLINVSKRNFNIIKSNILK